MSNRLYLFVIFFDDQTVTYSWGRSAYSAVARHFNGGGLSCFSWADYAAETTVTALKIPEPLEVAAESMIDDNDIQSAYRLAQEFRAEHPEYPQWKLHVLTTGQGTEVSDIGAQLDLFEGLT